MKKIEKSAFAFVAIAALAILTFWAAGVMEHTLTMEIALITSGVAVLIAVILFAIHKLRVRNLCD